MRSPNGQQRARDLVGAGADHRLAVHRVADRIRMAGAVGSVAGERTGVALGDLDLLEDEREVGRRDDEALADGGGIRLRVSDEVGPRPGRQHRGARTRQRCDQRPRARPGQLAEHGPAQGRAPAVRGERCILVRPLRRRDTDGGIAGSHTGRARAATIRRKTFGYLSKGFPKTPDHDPKAAEFRPETGQTPALVCFACGFSTPTRVLAASTLDPKSTVARPAAGNSACRPRRPREIGAEVAPRHRPRARPASAGPRPALEGLPPGAGAATEVETGVSQPDPDPHPGAGARPRNRSSPATAPGRPTPPAGGADGGRGSS